MDPIASKSPSLVLCAAVLAAGAALGLYDRSDIVTWALDVIEREAQPPIAIIELAMSSKLDDSAVAALLHQVPGERVSEHEVHRALVGVIARAVGSDRLDPRSAARRLYGLCIDASGELYDLARFDDDFYFVDDGVSSYEEVVAALRESLRSFEHLADGVPVPGRHAASA